MNENQTSNSDTETIPKNVIELYKKKLWSHFINFNKLYKPYKLSSYGKSNYFSAPSGAGKSTIVNYLLEKGLGLEFSISATCRAPGEKKYMVKSIISYSRWIQETNWK